MQKTLLSWGWQAQQIIHPALFYLALLLCFYQCILPFTLYPFMARAFGILIVLTFISFTDVWLKSSTIRQIRMWLILIIIMAMSLRINTWIITIIITHIHTQHKHSGCIFRKACPLSFEGMEILKKPWRLSKNLYKLQYPWF